jgi:hypothetical protein
MPSFPTVRRRDPWWDLEGPAARRTHLRRRFTAMLALTASLVACGGAGALWAIAVGLVPFLGIQLTLPLR